MQTHILDYLTETVQRVPEKMAYSDGTDELCFREVYEQSRAVGTFLSGSGIYKEPVVIFMNKHPKMAAAFYGTVFGGNYCPYRRGNAGGTDTADFGKHRGKDHDL